MVTQQEFQSDFYEACRLHGRDSGNDQIALLRNGEVLDDEYSYPASGEMFDSFGVRIIRSGDDVISILIDETCLEKIYARGRDVAGALFYNFIYEAMNHPREEAFCNGLVRWGAAVTAIAGLGLTINNGFKGASGTALAIACAIGVLLVAASKHYNKEYEKTRDAEIAKHYGIDTTIDALRNWNNIIKESGRYELSHLFARVEALRDIGRSTPAGADIARI